MATANAEDERAQRVAEEAAVLFGKIEPMISQAESLADQGEWTRAIALLETAAAAYDHKPGVWPIVSRSLPGWEIALRSQGKTSDDPAVRAVKEKRARATALARAQEKRPPWNAVRISGADSVVMEDPWPDVVRAFCDSRPTARVQFRQSDTSIPAGRRERVERAIADSIRAERTHAEDWIVTHFEPQNEDSYLLRFSSAGKDFDLKLEGEDATPEGIRSALPAFFRENWG